MPATRVVLHHLTDVHIGPLENQPTVRISGVGPSNRRQFYLDYLARAERKPDVVVISGDFCSWAAPGEFSEAENFIRGISALLGPRNGHARICMVPGNHDVYWASDGDRLQRFRDFARNLESIAVSSESRSPYVFYPDLSVLIHCFNSCHLGGTRDKRLDELIAKLGDAFRAASSDHSALAELNDLSRQDPGFVRPEHFADLGDVAKEAGSALKIAVVHHNPSDVPSDDLDHYQAIVNGAAYKQALFDAGFDLVLYGHRHFPHLSYEEYVTEVARPSTCGGLYLLGGASFGCSTGPIQWYQITIRDSQNANSAGPPPSLIEVTPGRLENRVFKLDTQPHFRFTIGKKVSASLRRIHETLGRTIDPESRDKVRAALESVRFPLVRLQAQVDDWESDWRNSFFGFIETYSYIYGVDLLGPAAYLNPFYLDYLARQFEERVRRVRTCGLYKGLLHFSPAVLEAVTRTGWGPTGCCEIGARTETCNELEIVRILVWDHVAEQDTEVMYDVMQMVDRYHRLFGVPVFVLPPSALTETERSEEFVLGLGRDFEPHHCYQYDIRTALDTRDLSFGDARIRKERFLSLLANPELKSVAAFLPERA